MSLTLATVADALIEFILSLLRDPDVAAEFEDDPDQVLASRGLQHAGPSDVASVAPVIIERTQVVHVAVPKPVLVERDHSPVVREIKQVVSHMQWVDDRDTIVDQSVNQNIWAEGDVTQTFDNEAVVASGDDAVAAGEDATVEKTWDESVDIEAGEDVNIGNQTDVQVIEDAMNEDTDASTTTDASTDVVVEDSFDEESQQVESDGSFNDSETLTETTDAVVDIVIQDPAAPIDETEAPAEEAPADEEPPAEEPSAADPMGDDFDAAAQYVEAEVTDDGGDPFSDSGPLPIDGGTDDDTL